MIGKTLSHYKILEKLGEGGMGTVYKARDTRLDRDVALKFLPAQFTPTEESKQRFIREARAASAIDHPNICSIYAIEETIQGPDGKASMFIAMAFYEGMSLNDKIGQGPLPLKMLCSYALQLASGLQKAHEKDVVHRDLKPANIVITDDDRLKIIDFGLARASHHALLTKSGTTLGTVPYMSPEQAKAEKVDHRTDIWSFGVVIYEMLTGQRPFKSEYETALVYSILNEDPEPPTGLRSGVPMDLERLIFKCLEKDPADRYQHFDEIIVDLRKLDKGPTLETEANTSGLSAGESSQPGPLTDRDSPSVGSVAAMPKVWAYGVGVGVAVAALLLAGWFLVRPAQTAADQQLDQSIAVLPLENLSRDPDDEYFVDGMTEDIINSLSKIADLRVISRRSSMRYKGTDLPLKTIGEELNVSTILEGSVRRFGDALRISVQLVDVQTDNTVWSEQYDRQIADIFAIQSEVAQKVANLLKAHLTPDEIDRIEKLPTENLEAYDLFLRGRETWDFNRKALEEVVDLFNTAIRMDPDFALAYAYLAHTYHFLANFGLDNARETGFETVHQALQIDSTLAPAHWAHGQLLMGEGRLIEARRAFQRSVTLGASGMPDLSLVEYRFGRFDESLHWALLALERNPQDANLYYHAGLPLIELGNDAVSERFLRLGLEKEPLFGGPKPYHRIPILLARLEMQRGNNEKALEWMRGALELRPDNEELQRSFGALLVLSRSADADSLVERLHHQGRISPAYYAWVLYNRGKQQQADSIVTTTLESAVQRFNEGIESPGLAETISAFHSLVGNANEALDWLDMAYDMGYRFPRMLEQDPFFDPIRDQPRFRQIIGRMYEDIERMRARVDFSVLPGANISM